MRPRPGSDDHQATVARRLASLSAELAALRPGEVAPRPVRVVETDPGEPLGDHTRIRGWSGAGAEAVPVEGPVVREVTAPGRHAERRRTAALLPGPTHLAVVAAVVALGLGVTTWILVGGRPQEAPPVEATFSAARTGESPAAMEDSSSETLQVGEVTVDVAGKVRRPGIAVLPSGSRVVDAIDAAGGARPGADLSTLNLARVLTDGEQVLVGVASPSGVAGLAGTGPAPGALVNINTADQASLETLPGVGPVTAGAILAWRTEHGTFTAVEELVEVDGIGEATLAKLAPLVTV